MKEELLWTISSALLLNKHTHKVLLSLDLPKRKFAQVTHFLSQSIQELFHSQNSADIRIISVVHSVLPRTIREEVQTRRYTSAEPRIRSTAGMQVEKGWDWACRPVTSLQLLPAT